MALNETRNITEARAKANARLMIAQDNTTRAFLREVAERNTFEEDVKKDEELYSSPIAQAMDEVASGVKNEHARIFEVVEPELKRIHVFEYTSYEEAQALADWVVDRAIDAGHIGMAQSAIDEIVSGYAPDDLVVVRGNSNHFERYRPAPHGEGQDKAESPELSVGTVPSIPDDQLRLMVFQTTGPRQAKELQEIFEWVKNGSVPE